MHSFLKVESLGEARFRKSWNQLKGYDSQKLNKVIGSQREEINRALQGDEQHRRYQLLLH